MSNKNLILTHSNSLKSNLTFQLKNNTDLLETIPNSDSVNVYALITMSVTSSTKNFNNIHIMYLLDLKSYFIIDISVSDTRFKSEDVKSMISRCQLEENSVIITLSCSPFTTHVLVEFFTTNKYNHIFYNKRHFTPIIDSTKDYFHGMTLMTLLDNGVINDASIKEFAKAWNRDAQPVLKKFSDNKNLNTCVLYFK
jgi:hypothetical protein